MSKKLATSFMAISNLGSVIRARRSAIGLTQFELAESCNCSQKTISMIERNEKSITQDEFYLIMQALDNGLIELNALKPAVEKIGEPVELIREPHQVSVHEHQLEKLVVDLRKQIADLQADLDYQKRVNLYWIHQYNNEVRQRFGRPEKPLPDYLQEVQVQ